MKIAVVNHSDTRGGASVVSLRLTDALRAAGHEAVMLTVHGASGNPAVTVAAPALRRRIPFIKEQLRIFAGNGMDRGTLFKISIATDGLPLSRHPAVRDADLVILNWVNQGMLSLEEIGRIAAEHRVVWIMHDMWCATGICHHAGTCLRYTEAGGCHDCPLLGRRGGPDDLSARTWRRKERLYGGADIRFVAVSHWLAERCAESALLRGRDVAVVPNAFPVDTFHTVPRLSRAECGLPGSGKIVLMGAARLDDPIKGLPMAIEALNGVAYGNFTPVFFGAVKNGDAFAALRRPYVHLGTVGDPALLRELYAHAHTVISTSYYETLPGTLVEAQGAGAWPVAFDAGGQRDIITGDAEGTLVPAYDTAAFAAAIDASLRTEHSREALHSAAGRFAPAKIAHEIVKF